MGGVRLFLQRSAVIFATRAVLLYHICGSIFAFCFSSARFSPSEPGNRFLRPCRSRLSLSASFLARFCLVCALFPYSSVLPTVRDFQARSFFTRSSRVHHAVRSLIARHRILHRHRFFVVVHLLRELPLFPRSHRTFCARGRLEILKEFPHSHRCHLAQKLRAKRFLPLI